MLWLLVALTNKRMGPCCKAEEEHGSMSNKVVVEVIDSAQQSPLRVPEWRGCLSIVVVWDDETLSLSRQGPAAIVLRQGGRRRHHARENLDLWWSL